MTGRAAPSEQLAHTVSVALQFAAALGIAGLVAFAIWTQLPRELEVRTDIVGYPIHSNFNPYLYFWGYWLIALFVPLATLGLFYGLSRLMQGGRVRRRSGLREPAHEAPAAEAPPWQVVATGIGRLLFVGAVLGLETAAAVYEDESWIFAVGVPVTAGYAGLAALLALAAGRVRRMPKSFSHRLALVNAVAVPFSFAGLYAVSRSTSVTVQASAEVRDYPWLPGWLAAAGTVALLAWAIGGAVRARAAAGVRAHERRLLLTIAGPVALLLLLGSLPGVSGYIDMFHDGEPLAGAKLTEDGAFPWRDLIFIHGFLADVVIPWLGFTQFEHSRWGSFAGTYGFVVPLYWISVYYLCAYLFRRSWLFLVGTQAAVVLGVIVDAHIRFILLPVALLLLAALLSKPSAARASTFTAVVIAQAVLTPEAGLMALSLLASVLLFDVYYYRRGRPLTVNFRRTLFCAATGVVISVFWFTFLAAFGALDDFVFAYRTFASGHALTGAFPLTWLLEGTRFVLSAIAPVVLVILAIWYFGLHLIRGRSLTVADWTMGALAIFVGLYYHKYLARPDAHVYQSFSPAVPLLFYAVYRLISLVEMGLRQVRPRLAAPARVAITATAVAVLALAAPRSLADAVGDAPTRFDATVPAEPKLPAAGFVAAEDIYVDLTRDLDTILDAYAGPEGAVFDFTNNPGLFHYLLHRPSPTRYYHVSMAIRAGTQSDLVEELARRRPRVVVFSGNLTGLQAWDGIYNQVRHYRVSRFLLDHYRPVAKWNGFVFMGLKGVRFPPASSLSRKVEGTLATGDLYSKTQPCDWGYAPNFFAESPDREAIARPLPLRVSRLVSLHGWAIDPTAKAPAAAVLAAIDGKVVARRAPSSARRDITAHLKDRGYLRSGYQLDNVSIPLVDEGRARALRIYGLSRSGRATELSYGPSAPRQLRRGGGPQTLLLGERRIPVVAGATRGFVDSSSLAGSVFALDIPPSARLARYDWLEIVTALPLQENAFTVTDLPTNIDHGIYFKTLTRGETSVRVEVGACSQWHGYRSRRLYLLARWNEAVRAVRLYR